MCVVVVVLLIDWSVDWLIYVFINWLGSLCLSCEIYLGLDIIVNPYMYIMNASPGQVNSVEVKHMDKILAESQNIPKKSTFLK